MRTPWSVLRRRDVSAHDPVAILDDVIGHVDYDDMYDVTLLVTWSMMSYPAAFCHSVGYSMHLGRANLWNYVSCSRTQRGT